MKLIAVEDIQVGDVLSGIMRVTAVRQTAKRVYITWDHALTGKPGGWEHHEAKGTRCTKATQ